MCLQGFYGMPVIMILPFFNLLMIRCLLAAAKPYVAIGDEKLTTKLQKKRCLDSCLQSYISRS